MSDKKQQRLLAARKSALSLRQTLLLAGGIRDLFDFLMSQESLRMRYAGSCSDDGRAVDLFR